METYTIQRYREGHAVMKDGACIAFFASADFARAYVDAANRNSISSLLKVVLADIYPPRDETSKEESAMTHESK